MAIQDSPLASGRFAEELKAATEAVRIASRLCQIVQRQLSDAEKIDKNDDSPVTVADYGAQAVVAYVLQQADPSTTLSMVAEEDSVALRAPEGAGLLARITQLVNDVLTAELGAQPLTGEQVVQLIDLGASPGGAEGRHWVLDPIDGTRGFVGQRQYAVCLGMLQDGVVELGVLGCPNLPLNQVQDDDGGAVAVDRHDVGCLFLAHRGHGAYQGELWDKASPLRRIRVQDADGGMSDVKFMESYESRHSSHSFTGSVAELAGITATPLRMDSQCKYGLLSRGDAAVFMRFPPPTYREKIWDHCAGFVIVEEAGGKVTDAGGVRLDFSRGRWLDLDRGIVAAPPKAHAAVLQAVNKLQSPQ